MDNHPSIGTSIAVTRSSLTVKPASVSSALYSSAVSCCRATTLFLTGLRPYCDLSTLSERIIQRR